VQNTNEVDDSKRHDVPRHRVEKVHVSGERPLLMKNPEIFQYLALSDRLE